MDFCYSNTIRRSCLFVQKMLRPYSDELSALYSLNPYHDFQPTIFIHKRHKIFIYWIFSSPNVKGMALLTLTSSSWYDRAANVSFRNTRVDTENSEKL